MTPPDGGWTPESIIRHVESLRVADTARITELEDRVKKLGDEVSNLRGVHQGQKEMMSRVNTILTLVLTSLIVGLTILGLTVAARRP